jgi:hypothetical protein
MDPCDVREIVRGINQILAITGPRSSERIAGNAVENGDALPESSERVDIRKWCELEETVG